MRRKSILSWDHCLCGIYLFYTCLYWFSPRTLVSSNIPKTCMWSGLVGLHCLRWVSECKCVCVCEFVCMVVHVFVCMSTFVLCMCVHVCEHVCLPVFVNVRANVWYVHVCVYAYVGVCVCMWASVYVCICVCLASWAASTASSHLGSWTGKSFLFVFINFS